MSEEPSDNRSESRTNIKEQKTPQYKLRWCKHINMLLAIFTFLSAAFGICAGLVGNHGHKQVATWLTYAAVVTALFIPFKMYDEAHPDGAKHTESHAPVSSPQDASTDAVRRMKIEKRAWVVTLSDAGTTAGHFEVGHPLACSIHAKNSGVTPAKQMRAVQFAEAIFDPGTPNFEKVEAMLKERPGSIATLAPNDTVALNVLLVSTLTETLANQIRTGEVNVFVFGKIIYFDIFDCEHLTTFCLKLNPENLKLVIWNTHNELDNNETPD